MNNNIREEDKNIQFLEGLNSKLAVKRDYENKTLNSKWIDMFEEVIPYIDNILRNPKRFIVNEEEIVKVELAKKITVESVIHLTQHTNLIQDYNPENGDVRPSKILNINKDESLDTYENRFVFTLINNMNMFYNQRLANFSGGSSYYDKIDLDYEGNTKIDNDQINVKLSFKSLNKDIADNNKENGKSVEDRLKKIKVQLDGFSGSELMQTLNKLHVPPVRSPIRKTNVILKNPNFQKASELWNYIQSYDSTDYEIMKDNQDYMDFGELKKQFDQSFFLNYLAKEVISETSSKSTEKKAVSLIIKQLVDNLLEYNPDLNEGSMKLAFSKEFKESKKRITERDKNIRNIFIDRFNNLNEMLIKAGNLLEEEV